MLTVHPGVPATTVKDLVAHARANPGKLNYASSGTASIVHLAGELFNLTAGISTIHIPYKGSGPALTDLLAGQVNMMFASPVPTVPHVKSGRLRAIAIASDRRSTSMPELPTVSESGFPGFEAATFFIVLGPAGIPERVVSRLGAEMGKAAQAADVAQRLSSEGAVIVAGSPQQAIAHIQSEVARWTKVVKAARITADK
jgi:tripartite-type tricarboxylate transporter receptor subunit TctC